VAIWEREPARVERGKRGDKGGKYDWNTLHARMKVCMIPIFKTQER
jgi:hypothetical protein